MKPLTTRISGALRQLAVAVLAIGLCVTAAAQDEPPITITVPVSLQNMHPDVRLFFVSCLILDADGSYLSGLVQSESQPLVDGAFSGDIVAVHNGDPSIAALAHSYLCTMSFGIRGVMGTHRPGPAPTLRHDPTPYVEDRLQAADGEPFVYYAQGEFPQNQDQ